MYERAVHTHYSTIQFVPECYKIQEMCDKGFNKSFLGSTYIPDRYKTQGMCDSIISEDPFSIRYVPDQYKTQNICDEAIDDFLAALKFVPDWFVTSKVIKIHFTFFYADENILYFNEDSGNVVFTCNVCYNRKLNGVINSNQLNYNNSIVDI